MLTREDLIAHSTFDYMEAAIRARGYTDDQVKIIESWQGQLSGELDQNYIGMGFDFDDQGTQAELGSDLMRRLYTLEAFVFGLTVSWARNIANAVKFSLERDGTIPLLDYGQESKPEIDQLVVDGVMTERQPIADPEPWERYVWVTRVRVEDFYHASLV